MVSPQDNIGEICAQTALSMGQEIRRVLYTLTPEQRGQVCTSILKPEAKDRAKFADAKSEEIGVRYLTGLSAQTGFEIQLIVDPATNRTFSIGTKSAKRIFAYLDAVDGTIKVAGLGGSQYQANAGNWGIGVAFTEPTDKPLDELVIYDFATAAIVTGNPRTQRSAPQDVYAIVDNGRSKVVDETGKRVYTSTQKKLSQSAVFFEAFQAFDRNTNGFSKEKGSLNERLAIALYGQLINRNEGGAFDVNREYGNISALPAHMLGWREKDLPESQGGAYIVINENLPNMIPCVPIISAAGGLAMDFERHPLAARKLTEGRCNVIYAANGELAGQIMDAVMKAEKQVCSSTIV